MEALHVVNTIKTDIKIPAYELARAIQYATDKRRQTDPDNLHHAALISCHSIPGP